MMHPGRFDVIIVGGSYAGLSAAMALGRAMRRVLLIDGGKPANRFTPHSHNFLTQDGSTPGEIAALARRQVDAYPTVERIDGFELTMTVTLSMSVTGTPPPSSSSSALSPPEETGPVSTFP